MKRFFRPETTLFFGLWLVLMVGGQSRFFRDPGTFWHVAVGDRLIDSGFFDTDSYSFTFAGRPWIPHQWLGESAMAIVNRHAGFDGLLLVAATILAGVYTGLAMRLMRAGLHLSVTAVIVAGAVAASSGHFHVRPHLATIVGMAVLMVYLTDFENGRIPLSRLWWLVPVFWLWANAHGGALGGLATFALAGGAWAVCYFFRHHSPFHSVREMGRLVLIGVACAAVCVVNPYGYRLPLSWVEIYRMASLPNVILEHRPVEIGEWGGLTIVLFGAAYLLLLATVPWRQFRVTWLLPIVWFALAYTRVRHAPLFAVAALVSIADMFPATRLAARLVRLKSDLYSPPEGEADAHRPRAIGFLLPAVVVGVAAILQVAGLSVPVMGRGWARLDPAVWPVELLPELQAHQYDRPGGTRLFNAYPYGGFLIQKTPGYRVFIDDRCELYGDDFLVHFVAVQAALESRLDDIGGEDFLVWQIEYGRFDFALVETGGGFDRYFDRMPDAWEIVRRTGTATFYRKK